MDWLSIRSSILLFKNFPISISFLRFGDINYDFTQILFTPLFLSDGNFFFFYAGRKRKNIGRFINPSISPIKRAHH